jgi:lipoteichoic acid synthase
MIEKIKQASSKQRLARFSIRSIGPSLIRTVKTPDAVSVLFFLLFIFSNAIKSAIFNRLLIDLPEFASPHEFFSGFFGKVVAALVVYMILTRSKRWYWFAGFYFLQALYMFVNLSYHLSLMGYLHISQYTGLFLEGFDLVKHAAIPRDARLWFVLLDAPVFICLLIVYRRFFSFNKEILFKPALITAAAGLLLIILQWNPMDMSPKQSMNDAYASDISVVSKHGLLLFNIVDLFNFRDTRRHIRSLSYGVEINAVETTTTPLNIVALQIESLDAFIVDTKYKNRFVTPFLHELSQKSVFFPYMLSYHKAGSTSDCEFSTINSVEPFDDFPSIKIRNYDYPNSALKCFSSQGYSVEAFHGNRGSYFNRIAAFAKMGFHTFHNMFSMGLTEVGWGAPDRAVFDFVKTRLMTQKGSFFYYIITMTSHEPFTLARPYYKNNLFSGISNEYTRDYFNTMSYVDRELKEIVGSIKSSHPNTCLFIFGDHTPIIPKNVYERSSFINNSAIFEFVPLFIITPDSRAYRENSCVATFIDIAPTMLAASGIPYSLHTSGTNLLKEPIKDGVVCYRGATYSRAGLYAAISREKKRFGRP